jgi:hypothetical protein
MAIQPALLTTAQDEWKRWGFSTVPIHGGKSIGGLEGQQPYVQFVNDYWVAVGKPSLNGKSPYPWSAAFISFCFKTAAAGTAFPYNEAHWGYCEAIVARPKAYPKLKRSGLIRAYPRRPDLGGEGRGGLSRRADLVQRGDPGTQEGLVVLLARGHRYRTPRW